MVATRATAADTTVDSTPSLPSSPASCFIDDVLRPAFTAANREPGISNGCQARLPHRASGLPGPWFGGFRRHWRASHPIRTPARHFVVAARDAASARDRARAKGGDVLAVRAVAQFGLDDRQPMLSRSRPRDRSGRRGVSHLSRGRRRRTLRQYTPPSEFNRNSRERHGRRWQAGCSCPSRRCLSWRRDTRHGVDAGRTGSHARRQTTHRLRGRARAPARPQKWKRHQELKVLPTTWTVASAAMTVRWAAESL